MPGRHANRLLAEREIGADDPGDARYRVSHDPYEWGMAGYSSGGFCSANLALRRRGSFGAAAIIEGYFRAAGGPAAAALNHSQPLEAANSPLYLAERLATNCEPVPACWVAAGTHDASDYQPAAVFAAAMDRIWQVPFIAAIRSPACQTSDLPPNQPGAQRPGTLRRPSWGRLPTDLLEDPQ